MSEGITLKNGQMLLGASIGHLFPTTVGAIVVPPLSSNSPRITNVGGNVITLANDNAISGFYVIVDSPSVGMIDNSGIAGTGIFNGFASRIRAAIGSICLSFVNNQATPAIAPEAYRFVIGGGGTFNLTPCDYESVNSGVFSLSGVHSVQTCPEAVICP